MPTIDIDRDAAHQAAERELAKPLYPRPSPKQYFAELVDKLLRQLAEAGTAVPGGWLTTSLLLIALAVAVVAAIRIGQRTLGGGRHDQPLFGPAELSAADHRAAAEQAAASGDWAEAIRQRLRAIARELEYAGVLHPVPGRTANELARAAGAAIPQLAAELARAAETFNDVSYGGLPATAAGYRTIAELDDRLRSTPQPAHPAATAEPWRHLR